MTPRFQYIDYNHSHATAEIIYRMLMLRIRYKLRVTQ